MGHRLSKIVTRSGDAGETGLGDGTRVAKDSLRIDAIGDVDELNSCIGLILTENLPHEINQCLINIQHDLFDLGAELSVPVYINITERQVHYLEELINHHNEHLPPLEEFILPGGSRAASFTHLARTICRRTERTVIKLSKNDVVSEMTRKYLNRLSDLLFVLSRTLNRHAGQNDVLWQPGKNR